MKNLPLPPLVKKTLWRGAIAAAAFGLYAALFTFWFKPASRSQLTEASKTIASLVDTEKLSVPLEQIDRHQLVLRDRASVISFYTQAQFATKTIRDDAALLHKRFSEPAYFKIFGSLSTQANDVLKQTNQLLEDITPIYTELETIFNRSEKASYALNNFYYYDPSVDEGTFGSAYGPDEAPARYAAAAAGLRTVANRLKTVPDYPDPSIKKWLPNLTALADDAQAIADLSSTDRSQAQLRAGQFTKAVVDLQALILTQRQTFWDNYAGRQDLLDNLSKTRARLTALQTSLDNVLSKF